MSQVDRSNAALDHMDMMRGLAAIAVLAGHVRGLFFADLTDQVAPSLLVRVLYLLTGYGHQALLVFFVLSGFFIGTSVLGSRSRGTWSWEGYLTRRFTRLYVVLVPALVLTALLDLSGMRLFGVANVYAAKLHAPLLQLADARESLGVGAFLGNLCFLAEIFVPTFGTNGPLWSLGYEFWCYILLPLAAAAAAVAAPAAAPAAAQSSSSAKERGASLLLMVPILVCGGPQLVKYLGIWLLGVAVSVLASRLRADRARGGLGALVSFVVFGLVLTAARASHTHALLWDYAAGAATAALLLSLLARERSVTPPGRHAGYARTAAFLASFSYTLYLTHYPMIAFVNAAVVGVERWQPAPLALLEAAGLTLGVLVASYLLSLVTERNTEPVRAWVVGSLARARPWVRSRFPGGA